MKTALIIGSSGLIGTELTKQLVQDERYNRIQVLVRTPLPFKHPKLHQIKYDFNWPDENLIQGDELYCCLGTTIKKAGSQEAFRKVDFDYIVNTATLALNKGLKKMAVVSSIGAHSESKVFYSKVKGDTENALKKLNFDTLIILRPSLLLGNRAELRMAELVGAFFSTAFSFAIPDKYKAIEAKDVATCMIRQMNRAEESQYTLESDEISTSLKE